MPFDAYKEGSERIINDEFPWYTKLLEESFDFTRRGFQMVYSGSVPNSHPIIVYESKACRVRFRWMLPEHEYIHSETIWINYGRLHAPIFENVMEWNGEKCRCWQLCFEALSFLDGLTPQETFENKRSPTFILDFYDENKGKGWRNAEFIARREAAVWEHYGQRLFDIFDLNRLDLWEQYTNFLKEFHSIGETYVNPFPLYKVC